MPDIYNSDHHLLDLHNFFYHRHIVKLSD